MKLDIPIAQGNTAKIYLSEDRVIKVFHDYFAQEEAINEASKQETVRASGLAVPKILDVTKVDGSPAIIMEYIKGKTLGELALESLENADYYINISVDIQRKIHDVNLGTIESLSTKLKKKIQLAQKLSVVQKAKLIDKLEQMPMDNRLCHGDFHLFNLIMSDDKVFIIDWVDSSIGDIRADVYRTYLLYSQEYKELAELYINCYCEKSGILKEEILAWGPIIAGARLSEIVPTENEERLFKIIESC